MSEAEDSPLPQGNLEHFRKYFEQHYAPIDVPTQQVSVADEESPESENELTDTSESDWSGFSDQEEPTVHVVDYAQTSQPPKNASDKSYKTYMSSRPPTLDEERIPKPSSSKKQKDPGEDTNDAVNLKNDLALQRLLKESHLLESAKVSAPAGLQRHQANDLRLEALGSKGSILAQTKMPMSHRRGMNAKASATEAKRRVEAKENGIILERSLHTSKTKAIRRDRGIGGPGIGKFRGGELTLSRKDLHSLQGGKSSSRKGKRSK